MKRCIQTALLIFTAPKGSTDFISLGAGTHLGGIEIAQRKQSLSGEDNSQSPLTPSGQVLSEYIKAYLISHAHLDHVAGLVINSPVDSKKPIYGIPFTIDNIRDYLFNWKIGLDFGKEASRIKSRVFLPGRPQ